MRSSLLVLLVAVLPVTAMAEQLPEPPPPAAVPDPVMTPPSPPLEPAPDPADRPPPPGLRLMLSDLTVVRLNPLGLETRMRLGVQQRLYASHKAIARNNFAFAGVYAKLNPASAHLGAGGEIQPASIFNLRAMGEVQKYFGTLGFLQSFPTANANYSDATLADLRDGALTPPQTATVLHASIQPMLQLKVGPIAMRALFQLDYWNLHVRPGDTTAYEATFDTLLPDDGWTLSVDTDVLYTGKPNLAVGLRHSLVRPFYKDRHFTDQADAAAYDGANGHHRLGLFAAYTLADHGPSTFNKPTMILIVSWYLSHRWRLGEPDVLAPGTRPEDFTSRAFPYLLLGFAFESDLLAIR